MDSVTPRRRLGSDREPVSQNVSCLGCLGTLAGTMAVCTAIVWALNPGMTVEEAAREGILLGGGLSLGLTVLFCGVPIVLVIAVVAFALWRGRKAARSPSGPTIIDID